VPTFQFIGDFGMDWNQAWSNYRQLHHADQFREYYGLHTAPETLNIGVINAFGHILN